jgi:hypothetical protein
MDGMARILFICQTLSKRGLHARLENKRILRWVFLHAYSSSNHFIGQSDNEVRLQAVALNVVRTMKGAISFLGSNSHFDQSVLHSKEIKDFYDSFTCFHDGISTFQFTKNKFLAAQYRRYVCKFESLKEIVKFIAFTPDEKPLLDCIAMATKYFSGIMTTYQNTNPSWKKPMDEAIKQAVEDSLKNLLERYKWSRHVNSSHFLMSQALLDRGSFVFDVQHKAVFPVLELFDTTASSVICLVEQEITHGSNASESLLLFGFILENGMSNAAKRMGWTRDEIGGKFKLHSINMEWRSGRVTWDRAIRILDTAVDDMRLLNREIADRWTKERQIVVSKQPTAPAAFVAGIKKVWELYMSIFIFAVNQQFKEIAKMRNVQIYRELYAQFQSKYTVVRGRTFEIMVEVTNVFPLLKRYVMEKPRGFKFLYHGLFVTHCFTRRNPVLDMETCPNTLLIWGKMLAMFQQKVINFMDAALILSVCKEHERGAVARYMLLSTTKGPLVPIFMPLSHETVDHAEFVLKSKDPKKEASLVKLLALGALHLAPKKLPRELEELQEVADGIMRELSIIIRADRGIHCGYYTKVIDMACKHFEEPNFVN